MIADEHFIPINGLDLTPYIDNQDSGAVHHLIRYAWAVEVIASLPPIGNILDIACGAGYGSFIFAQKFPQIAVMGVDYDPKAIEYARHHYALPNLTFMNGDGTRWQETIGSQIYDCIVSFDTIEHVPHREIMLENLINHLSPNGVVLLSTPCGGSVNELQPTWSAHRIEYSTASLFDFLSRYFRTILRPDDELFPAREVFNQLQGTGIDYLLRLNPVLCSGAIRISNPYRENINGDNPHDFENISRVTSSLITHPLNNSEEISSSQQSTISTDSKILPTEHAEKSINPSFSNPSQNFISHRIEQPITTNTFSYLFSRVKSIARERGLRAIIPTAIHHLKWMIENRRKQK